MADQPFHTLRCIKCFCHFSNILELNGMVKIEKKCPKCKAVNLITLTNKDMVVQCKLVEEAGESGPKINSNGLDEYEY